MYTDMEDVMMILDNNKQSINNFDDMQKNVIKHLSTTNDMSIIDTDTMYEENGLYYYDNDTIGYDLPMSTYNNDNKSRRAMYRNNNNSNNSLYGLDSFPSSSRSNSSNHLLTLKRLNNTSNNNEKNAKKRDRHKVR